MADRQLSSKVPKSACDLSNMRFHTLIWYIFFKLIPLQRSFCSGIGHDYKGQIVCSFKRKSFLFWIIHFSNDAKAMIRKAVTVVCHLVLTQSVPKYKRQEVHCTKNARVTWPELWVIFFLNHLQRTFPHSQKSDFLLPLFMFTSPWHVKRNWYWLVINQ